MNHLTCCGLLLLAACAAPRAVERSAAVPLGEPVPLADLGKDQGRRAAADRSVPAPIPETAMPVAPMSGAAGGDSGVSYRTVTQIVEVPAAAPVAAAPSEAPDAWSSGYGNDQGYRQDSGYYRARRYREPWFPVNTVVGFGIGSSIDHHRWHHGHHGHRGAWIGGGVGLLLDLHRLWR